MAITQAKFKGNLGAIADYFLDVDTDLGDYYLAEDGEPSTAPPRALGGLAARLGITGEVTAEHLLRLLDGHHPITGERLLEYRKDRVAGIDQTASAPKSGSVVWAVGTGGASRGRAGAGHGGVGDGGAHAPALPAGARSR